MAARMLGWVVALGMLAVSGSAVADYRELDGIVAIVDDDVVLASELVERVDAIRKSLKANNTPMPPDNILVSQVLERLIIENLQLQQADRRGIEIDDEMLTRAVLQFAEGNKMTLEQFQAALARDGMSYLAFREVAFRSLTRRSKTCSHLRSTRKCCPMNSGSGISS